LLTLKVVDNTWTSENPPANVTYVVHKPAADGQMTFNEHATDVTGFARMDPAHPGTFLASVHFTEAGSHLIEMLYNGAQVRKCLV
jgi:hypothetical protein